MKFTISPEVNPECDEKIKDSRSSRDGYTMDTKGYMMKSEPYTIAIRRTRIKRIV